jgi:hypothetical protein
MARPIGGISRNKDSRTKSDKLYESKEIPIRFMVYNPNVKKEIAHTSEEINKILF